MERIDKVSVTGEGYIVLQYRSGGGTIIYPEAHKAISRYPDGTCIECSPDGTKITSLDGSATYLTPPTRFLLDALEPPVLEPVGVSPQPA